MRSNWPLRISLTSLSNCALYNSFFRCSAVYERVYLFPHSSSGIRLRHWGLRPGLFQAQSLPCLHADGQFPAGRNAPSRLILYEKRNYEKRNLIRCFPFGSAGLMRPVMAGLSPPCR
jgi:hypothetical protein